jgi:tRNA(Arg) A34 adenosine deaminase TadA
MVTLNNYPTQHAEVVAIQKACKAINNFNLSGYTLYTSCEPCPMCLGAIYWSRIDKIYYGNSKEDAKEIDFDDQHIYDELKKPIHERKIKMVQLEKKYAKKHFQEWQEKEDKIKY